MNELFTSSCDIKEKKQHHSCLLCGFCGTPHSGSGVSLTLLPSLETLFLLLRCLIQP